jgi:hypothetical protein
MPLSYASETSLLQLLFQNATFSAIGSGLPGATTAGSFYISLHTASPGGVGTQQTNEAAYTGYARVPVARSSGAFSISGNNPAIAVNIAAVTFPQATAGSEIETFFAIGTAATGAGSILVFGALTSSLNVSAGITPSFAAGQMQCTCT